MESPYKRVVFVPLRGSATIATCVYGLSNLDFVIPSAVYVQLNSRNDMKLPGKPFVSTGHIADTLWIKVQQMCSTLPATCVQQSENKCPDDKYLSLLHISKYMICLYYSYMLVFFYSADDVQHSFITLLRLVDTQLVQWKQNVHRAFSSKNKICLLMLCIKNWMFHVFCLLLQIEVFTTL